MIGIRQQIILEFLIALPTLECFDAISADTEYNRILGFQTGQFITEGTGLGVTTTGVGLGEGEDHHFFAVIIAEVNGFSILIQ